MLLVSILSQLWSFLGDEAWVEYPRRYEESKNHHESGKPEVQVYACIFMKTHLAVNTNGFRLALQTFSSDKCIQLTAHIWIFIYRTKNAIDYYTIWRLKRAWKLESLRSWAVRYTCSHYSLSFLTFLLLILLLIFFPFNVCFLEVLITAV